MEKISYTVKDENGIHARPAGIIVNEAKKYEASLTMECKGKTADCKRLFSVMSLGAENGDTLCITAEGRDEKEAVCGLVETMTKIGL